MAIRQMVFLISGGNMKSSSRKSLSKIFTLLLNTKVNTAEKILKIKIALETTVKIWSGQKQQ